MKFLKFLMIAGLALGSLSACGPQTLPAAPAPTAGPTATAALASETPTPEKPEPTATATVEQPKPSPTPEAVTIVLNPDSIDWESEIGQIEGLKGVDVNSLSKFSVMLTEGSSGRKIPAHFAYDEVNDAWYLVNLKNAGGQRLRVEVDENGAPKVDIDFGNYYLKPWAVADSQGRLIVEEKYIAQGLQIQLADGKWMLIGADGTQVMVGKETAAMVENELVTEGAVCVSKELCLGMEITPEGGAKLYEAFVDAIANNKILREHYWPKFLGNNPSKEDVLKYLRDNNYQLPPRFIMVESKTLAYITMNPKATVERPINLRGIKVVAFGYDNWEKDPRIADYLATLDHYRPFAGSHVYESVGLGIDQFGNIVIVVGSKYESEDKNLFPDNQVISGKREDERESMELSTYIQTILEAIRYYEGQDTMGVMPYGMDIPGTFSADDAVTLKGIGNIFE